MQFYRKIIVLSLAKKRKDKIALNVTFTCILENLHRQTKHENQYVHWKVCLLDKYFHKNLWIILRSEKFVSQCS